MSQDPKLLHFLQQAEEVIGVTKNLFNMYLQATYEDETAAYYLDTTVTKFLKSQKDDIAVTKYLGSTGRFSGTDRYLNGFPEL